MNRIVLFIVILCLATGCRPAPTPTPMPPTATPLPKATATPTVKVWPTSSTPAPEEPVIPLGYTTTFTDTQHNVSGQAIMAGLQTILLNNFTYDGQCPTAEVRLVKEGNLDQAVVVLGKLEQRPYDHELLVLTVPSDLKPGDADSIAIYCPELKTSFGWGRFQ